LLLLCAFEPVVCGFNNITGAVGFEQKRPDTIFEYRLKLQPQEYFQPSQFPEWDTRDALFWVNITAVYQDAQNIAYPWGWTNQPSLSWDRQSLTPLAKPVRALTRTTDPPRSSFRPSREVMAARLNRQDMLTRA
jgi:hypothetical protein